MKVITLARRFLSGHPKVGQLTGFRDKFLMGDKIHTIRRNEKGFFKDGDDISVREWSGVAYRSKQDVICNLRGCGVVPIRLYRGFGLVDVGGGVDPVVVPLNVVAGNDGMSMVDFMSWFFPPSGGAFWDGSLVYFTDFRY